MNIGLYESAASLTALERWQESVAQNMTSSQVPGFRKRTVEFSSLEMGQLQPDPTQKGSDGLNALFPTTTTGVSYTPGETTPTQRDLDVAIQGDGFFEIQRPDGTKAFTRAGQFQVNASRQVVTHDQMPVLTAAGTPIVLQPENGPIAISGDGAITQGDTQLGRLAIVKFPDTSKLIPIDDGMFVPPEGTDPEMMQRPSVLQGYIESSNVSPLQEMISLVQIARAYEANQKIITSRDEDLGKALDTLG